MSSKMWYPKSLFIHFGKHIKKEKEQLTSIKSCNLFDADVRIIKRCQKSVSHNENEHWKKKRRTLWK